MSNLTPAEQTLIEKAKVGEIADYRSRSAALDDLARGASWGDERTIRAEIIYALAVGTNPAWTVHAQGVRIKGARIIGALDLTAAKICCPLRIQQCYFQEAVNLSYASASFIYLSGSFVPDLTADRLECRGSLRLDNGFCSKGGVSLVGARIGGDLVCVGATLLNSRSVALSADGLVVEGTCSSARRFSR